ncbi:hypothetical protein C8Q72DRAFT_833951 [Fomitopsis betulina]|nr:hypothetical protein C8Q72DRAFT_833951 [Fomitopsis betulina]
MSSSPGTHLFMSCHPGYFLFSQLLLSALQAGITTSSDHHSRIIWLSSIASYLGTIH